MSERLMKTVSLFGRTYARSTFTWTWNVEDHMHDETWCCLVTAWGQRERTTIVVSLCIFNQLYNKRVDKKKITKKYPKMKQVAAQSAHG